MIQWHSLLVRQIAERCRDVLRDQDLVARIGWNEFAFLLPAIKGEGHALLACERISRTLRESFRVDGLRTLVRPTLGVGLFPGHAQEAEPLLRMAELARNEAAAHKRPIVVYSESLGHTLRERRAVEREFETALQDNAVLVYFQPQVALATGRATAAEALVRWRNRRGELVQPADILAACENVGLNWSLSTYMINTALQHCADWARQGWDLAVSVNLTASDLAEPELPDFVSQALGLWGVPAHKLTLEITEDSLIRDLGQTMTTLADVKALAVGLSIDDFGTGYRRAQGRSRVREQYVRQPARPHDRQGGHRSRPPFRSPRGGRGRRRSRYGRGHRGLRRRSRAGLSHQPSPPSPGVR
jgi:predicted signal transduction protein with EAL and GGDEF domain